MSWTIQKPKGTTFKVQPYSYSKSILYAQLNPKKNQLFPVILTNFKSFPANFNHFPALLSHFKSCPITSNHYNPFQAVSSYFFKVISSYCKQFTAISSHFKSFPAMSSPVQPIPANCQPFQEISIHFHTFPAIVVHFYCCCNLRPFSAMARHFQSFYPPSAISSNINQFPAISS